MRVADLRKRELRHVRDAYGISQVLDAVGVEEPRAKSLFVIGRWGNYSEVWACADKDPIDTAKAWSISLASA